MKDKLDNKIKGAFDGLEDDINPELIWSGINAKMGASKKKKRRIFVWWFGGIGLGMILLLSVFYFNQSSSILDNKANTNNKNLLASEYVVSKKINERHKDMKKTARVEIDTRVVEKNTVNQVAESNEIQRGDLKEAKEDKLILNGAGTNQNQVVSRNIAFQEKEMLSSHDRLFIGDIKQSISDDKNEFEAPSNREMFHIYTLDLKKIDLLKANVLQPELAQFVNPYVFNNKRTNDLRSFSTLELYTGISIGDKSVSSSNSDYVIKRNEQEKLLEQLALGIRMEITRFHDFTFFAGARYSKLTDRWQSDLKYVEDMPLKYIEYKTELLDGSIEEHYATGTFEHEINRYIEQFNSEQILSFPLEVRYGKQFNSWTFAVGMGLDINYLFASEHKVIGLDGLPVIETKESQFLSPFMSMGLHASYALSRNWDVTANLNYRQLSISSESIVSDLNSKYTLIGMELGLSRRFGW